MFIVAAIVFPQSFYPNIKSKYTDAIQNNNEKRFAIGLTTEYRANFLAIFVGVARWLSSPD